MTENTKLTYIFHCGEYETERSFKTAPTDDELDQAFDDWIYNCGLDSDELDEMIAEGDAGYYEI